MTGIASSAVARVVEGRVGGGEGETQVVVARATSKFSTTVSFLGSNLAMYCLRVMIYPYLQSIALACLITHSCFDYILNKLAQHKKMQVVQPPRLLAQCGKLKKTII
eukprot:82965_1